MYTNAIVLCAEWIAGKNKMTWKTFMYGIGDKASSLNYTFRTYSAGTNSILKGTLLL